MMIGLEIEPSSIKAALVRKKGGYELLKWEIFDIPEGVIKANKITDSDILLKILVKIQSLFDLKESNVAFSLSGPTNTAVRILDLPYVDEKEIRLNLPSELDKFIPFDFKEIYYDFHIIEKSKAKKMSKIIVAVALKEIVNDFVNLLEKAGMVPKIVDISCLALYNTYEVNYSEDELVALVNIGENVINFNIVRGKIPLYIRDSINAYHISIENSSEEEIRNYADEICAEIYRQVEYFKSFGLEKTLKKIYLTGIPLVSPYFLQSVEDRLDVPIHLLNIFRNIKIDKNLAQKMQKYSSLASISVGLSLRGTEKIK